MASTNVLEHGIGKGKQTVTWLDLAMRKCYTELGWHGVSCHPTHWTFTLSQVGCVDAVASPYSLG